MGIQELSSALEAEALRLEEAILADARNNANRMMREAEEKVATLQSRALRLIAKRKETEETLKKKMAAIADRKRKAAYEDAAINAVRERCRDNYRRFMASPEYAPFIRAELHKAREELGDGPRVAADAVTAAILGNEEGISIQPDGSVEDGFVARSADGRQRLYCTFGARFEKLWKREAPRFVLRIAGGEKDGV